MVASCCALNLTLGLLKLWFIANLVLLQLYIFWTLLQFQFYYNGNCKFLLSLLLNQWLIVRASDQSILVDFSYSKQLYFISQQIYCCLNCIFKIESALKFIYNKKTWPVGERLPLWFLQTCSAESVLPRSDVGGHLLHRIGGVTDKVGTALPSSTSSSCLAAARRGPLWPRWTMLSGALWWRWSCRLVSCGTRCGTPTLTCMKIGRRWRHSSTRGTTGDVIHHRPQEVGEGSLGCYRCVASRQQAHPQAHAAEAASGMGSLGLPAR